MRYNRRGKKTHTQFKKREKKQRMSAQFHMNARNLENDSCLRWFFSRLHFLQRLCVCVYVSHISRPLEMFMLFYFKISSCKNTPKYAIETRWRPFIWRAMSRFTVRLLCKMQCGRIFAKINQSSDIRLKSPLKKTENYYDISFEMELLKYTLFNKHFLENFRPKQ